MSTPADEQVLVQQLAQGSREAFTQLYKHFQPRLHRYLLPFAEAYGEDADNILQDIFLKVWQKKETLTGVYSFELYLQRMARNRLIDLYRSNKTKTKHELHIAVNNTGNFSTEDEVEYKEYHRIAQEAIQKMPQRRQEIFKLSTVDDLSMEEIAANTGLSKAVIKKQLFKASSFIRAYIKKNSMLLFVITALIIMSWLRK